MNIVVPPEVQAAEDSSSHERIDIRDAGGLKRWAKALGVTTEALESAVHAVGPRIDKIKDHLTAGMAGQQQGG